ncbi:hypothetical protein [Hymenobacter crusticola]|uniref:Outer membrane protein beta-barrel domain-containing protein n=1 Tax=Hymenobacter crusticola TaxID=1770526 RepID=A0A2C9ZU29_9BACT|nr:hypothetical protein [Hymenobacter crusticola]OUJ70438.1 hypothetical protein BXP70_24040 [Hymenobacter crusticola]
MNLTTIAPSVLAMSLLLAPSTSFAQGLPPLKRHELTLRTGATQFTVHDQNASPLTYRGQLLQLGLSYQHHAERSEWFVGGHAAYGSFFAKAYPERMVYFGDTPVPLHDNLALVHMQVHYLRHLWAMKRGEVLLGGGLQQVLYYPQSEPYAGMTSITSLPLVAKVRYRVGAKTVLTAQGQYAVAGLITRLPWHNSLSQPQETSQLTAFYRNNTQVEGGHRLQQATLSLTACRTLGTHWQTSLGYELGLLHYPDPQPLTTNTHGLNLHLQFAF